MEMEMTSLRINFNEFKHVCNNARDDMQAFFDPASESIYSYFRSFVKDAEDRILAAPANPADDLRTALKVASRAAMEYGATQAQINFIVSLAIKNNDFNVLSGGRLTKGEASRIIDEMKK